MRFALALSIMLLTFPAFAQDAAVSVQDRAQIQSVITGQLDAFRRLDADAAFTLASPMIQQMFGTAPNFMSMVSRAYKPVFHSRQSAFGTLASQDGEVVQHVELTGPNGGHYLALYRMKKQPDGSWKIDGCQLVKSDSVGV